MTTPIGPRKPRKQQAAEALDHIRITPEQARTAGSLGQVGTATGSLAGAALGAIVGAAAKHPAQGAGLGAGIGGALGGGSGAAAGLYAARPRKPKKAVLPKPPSPVAKAQRRESDGRFAAGGAALATAGAGVAGSGAYQQTRALANHTLATTEAHVKRNAANAAMGVASQLRGEHGEARRAFYRNAMGEADQAVHRANAAYKVATAGTKNRYLLGAGLITAGAGLAAGGHAHKKVVQKNFDESQVRRQRGQFAPKGGMTAVPGASKPRVSEDAQTKAARAGLVGAQAADIVGIKSAWHETRNAEKVGEGVKATLKYAGKRAAFPIVAGGLGATLLADHVMRNQQRKLQGTPVAKSASSARAPRYDKKTGRRVRNAHINPTTNQARAQRWGSQAAGVAGATVGGVVGGFLPEEISHQAKNAYLRRQISGKTATNAHKVARVLGTHGRGPLIVGGVVTGGALGLAGAKKGITAFQHRGTTTERRDPAGRFAKAADPLAARKKSTRETAATGAALVAAGEAGGLAASRRAAHHTARSTLATRVATSGPNSPWLKGPMRQKASHIALESGMKANGMKAAARSARVIGRGYGGLVLGAGVLGMAAAHKASRPKTTTPSVSKSHTTQEIAMPAPDVNELFSKARELAYESEVAKFEVETKRAAKTGAKWGAGIGGTTGAISGAVGGAHLAGAKGAVVGGLAGAARNAVGGAVSYGAIGAGVGAIKAKKRINRTAGVAQP